MDKEPVFDNNIASIVVVVADYTAVAVVVVVDSVEVGLLQDAVY